MVSYLESSEWCTAKKSQVYLVPYSGIFSREKFFANRRYVRPNGNFGGIIFAVPLKQSHTYLTRATLSSVVRVCFENKGVMSVSYTLESMILSNLSLLFSEVVVRPRSYLPDSLVAGSMAFTALLAAAMLEAGACIDSEPSGSGSANSTRWKYLYSATIQGRF